jgi:phospholipid/cholesterol/gamma-HCH transport system substrate-binding protein
MLDRRIKIQLALFTAIAVAAAALMIFRYMDLPAMLFGVGRYTVTLDLARAGGLYPKANVSYRGTVVGEVRSVTLTNSGVEAVLSLRSDYRIPSQLRADVHSVSAVGEQYVDLVPRSATAAPLKQGDVIAQADTTVPPDFDSLLDATNRGLNAIPHENLKTVIDESYTAVGGLGPELTRLVKGGSDLAIDSEKNLDALLALIDGSPPVLDSQAQSAGAINAWAAHVATISSQLAAHDDSVVGILTHGGAAADEGRQLFQRLQPALPLLLANLASVGQVAFAYQPAIEQILVLLPQLVAEQQGTTVANHNTKQAYRGLYLDFDFNLNLPPVCSTGFLPPQQQRVLALEDYPDRAPGDLYCRVPQDSRWNARGARNYPCLTKPGKRAPTAAMCESDEQYVPLNEGFNWKGDPNATWSGQPVPQPRTNPAPSPGASPPAPPTAPPIAAAEYDPATGNYIGPDGHVYTQSDLSHTAPKEHTWQSMLMPPNSP